MARVIGVVGGSGGVGASVFAAVLASTAAGAGRPAMLVDLDATGGGVDVVLGVEDAPGARWSGLHLAGGDLDPYVLLDGLVSWAGCHVLAADVEEMDVAAVSQVLDAVDGAVDTVVLDLPRASCAERTVALVRCDLVLVLARGDVAGVVAAHSQVRSLPDVPVGVLVRRGQVATAEVAQLVGAPLLGRLPRLGRAIAEPGHRLPRALRTVAGGVLDGLVLGSAAA